MTYTTKKENLRIRLTMSDLQLYSNIFTEFHLPIIKCVPNYCYTDVFYNNNEYKLLLICYYTYDQKKHLSRN